MTDNWTTVTYKRPQRDQNKPIENKSTPIMPITQNNWSQPSTIIFKKPSKVETTKVEKISGPNSHKDQNVSHYHRKIEEAADSEEAIPVKKVYSDDFRKKLIKTRIELGLNQKQLAQKLNIKEGIIKGIEANTEAYDPILVQKLTNFMQKTTA